MEKKLFKISSKLTGDCTGLCGDLDECKISNEDREKGVNIIDLINDGDKGL